FSRRRGTRGGDEAGTSHIAGGAALQRPRHCGMRRTMRPRTGSAWYWLLVLAQTAGTVMLTALIWWRWVGTPALSTELIASAAFYVLGARACAFVLTVLAYIAVSVDNLRDVLFAALRTSSHAMWLPPALLLLGTLTP